VTSSSSSPTARAPTPLSLSATLTTRPGITVETESWREKLFAALPLFLVGGVCIAVAVLLYLQGTVTTFGGASSVRLQPWILFVALGITGISAGMVAMLSEDLPPVASEVGKEIPSPVGSKARTVSPPVGGTVSAPRPAVTPPIWAEDWGPDSEAFKAAAAPSSPPDVILRQLDELEVSLRKKPAPPTRD
jgi:hypothetical protein